MSLRTSRIRRFAPMALLVITACTSVSGTTDADLLAGRAGTNGREITGAGGVAEGLKVSKTADGRALTSITKLTSSDASLKSTITNLAMEIDASAGGPAAFTSDFSGNVSLEGFATHAVTIKAEAPAVMSDQDNKVTVTDTTSGNQRIYTADQAYQSFTVRDGDRQLKIVVNPDGTFGVDGQPARTEADVARLALASPVIADASVQGLNGLYFLLQQDRRVTRAPICCVNCSGPNVDLTGNGIVADPQLPTRLVLAVLNARKAKLQEPPKVKETPPAAPPSATPPPPPVVSGGGGGGGGSAPDTSTANTSNTATVRDGALVSGGTWTP